MTRDSKAELWRKAAVLGSLWAASEIVLGSFLHNVRVPLRGHFLTGIGIAILAAGHRLWPRRGLLWRAGLVCAAMKSVSPSAVILGPMISISAEGFMLEAGVRLAGANAAGLILGGGLAMAYTLLHRFGSLFVFYGPETWTLYARGLEKFRAWASMSPDGLWGPILGLFALHFLGGVLAALVGLWASQEGSVELPAAGRAAPVRASSSGKEYSLAALAAHVLLIMAAMSLGSRLPLWGMTALTLLYAAMCVPRYPRARSMMKRFGLWLGVLTVSALAGLILGRWEPGVLMGLRAVLLTLGFACVGEELKNPVIRSWIERRGGRMFFGAVEQAFNSLPGVFAALPSGSRLVRHPVVSLRAAVAQAPALYESLSEGRVFILAGERGEGKSTAVAAWAQELRRSGMSVGGIHAPGLWGDGRRAGFDVVDLLTGQRRVLCRSDGLDSPIRVGLFRFDPEGLSFGLKALAEARKRGVDVLLVDEVGPLELDGKGWAPELDILVREFRGTMVWVVRRGLVEEVKKRWGLGSARTLSANEFATGASLVV
ncbi:MAG: nucleoside-triphosphatase [Elusimicrobiota bacterium]